MVDATMMTITMAAGLSPPTGVGCLEVRPAAVDPLLGEAEVTLVIEVTIVTRMTPTLLAPELLVVAPTSDRLSSC